MQTSLARRRRHRRNGGRPRKSGAASKVAIALPLFLFATFVLLGVVGASAAVAAYGYYSQGLEDPAKLLDNIDFDRGDGRLRPDRQDRARPLRPGQARRRPATTRSRPWLIDATTAVEDKTFWENAGFDPVGIVSAAIDTAQGNERGASTITQQLVRARLLPPSAFEGGRYERKVREIIQSIRLTQEYPGIDGKKKIMAAYLNQNFYGNRSYGIAAAAKSYFGIDDLSKLTLAQAAILAGIPQSPTTFDLIKNAEEECSVPVAEGADCPAGKTQLVVPAEFGRGRSARQDPRPDEDPERPHRRPVHRRRLRGGQGGEGRPQPAGLRRLARPPLRVAGPPPARLDPVRRRTRPTRARRSTPAATRSSRPSTGTSSARPRSGSRPRRSRRTGRTPRPTCGASRSRTRRGSAT